MSIRHSNASFCHVTVGRLVTAAANHHISAVVVVHHRSSGRILRKFDGVFWPITNFVKRFQVRLVRLRGCVNQSFVATSPRVNTGCPQTQDHQWGGGYYAAERRYREYLLQMRRNRNIVFNLVNSILNACIRKMCTTGGLNLLAHPVRADTVCN